MMRIWQQNVLILVWLLLLAGCAARGVPLPPTVQPRAVPTLSSPQAVATVIPWHVSRSGEERDLVYEFILSDGKGEVTVQKDKTTEWRWQPTRPGRYRVKVVVEDETGHRLASEWSPEYEIVPVLHLTTLTPDKPSPQQADRGAIGWRVKAEGGVPPLVYEFISQREVMGETGGPHRPEMGLAVQASSWQAGMGSRNNQEGQLAWFGKEVIEQQGESPTWLWRPLERGLYRISVRVRDAAGNTVESEQAVDYEILPPLTTGSLIAVLPLQNMSGSKVPRKKIQEKLKKVLNQQGVRLVDDQVMEDFIVRHRLRYSAGIDGDLARALREETGADSVLFSVVELYREEDMPKMSLTVWLDRCDNPPRVLWMASKSLSGDENPGLLDLGMVRDPDRLLDRVLVSLFASWMPTLMPTADVTRKEAAASRAQPLQGSRSQKFRPQEYYRSEIYSPQQRYSVAVMPFYNLSERKYAGELMELNFVRQLRRLPNFTVIEPGELRQYLLNYRIIMQDGLSLAYAEVIFAKLGVDLIVTGKVFDYDDYIGTIGRPIVDFSMEIFSRDGNKTVWTSKSYTNGEKGVFFFDLGKVYTAHNLAGQMVGAVAGMLGQ
jgi:TolB-like protein